MVPDIHCSGSGCSGLPVVLLWFWPRVLCHVVLPLFVSPSWVAPRGLGRRACKLVSGGANGSGPLCPIRGAAREPGRAGPILMAASCSPSPGRSPAHPGRLEASAPVAACLSPKVYSLLRRLAEFLSCWLEVYALRHFAGLQVAPQGDQQLAGHGHDHDLTDPPFGAAGAFGEPEAKRTVRLKAQPAPG